jgi:hypothetical protein
MRRAAYLCALLGAGLARAEAPPPVAAILVSVEERGEKVKVRAPLVEALTASGWRVVAAGAPPERCTLTGLVHSQKSPKGVTTHYMFQIAAESETPLAIAEGDVKNASAHNAQVQMVNAVRSALTSALAAHPMPNVLMIRGVEDDGEVRAMKAAFNALPGVTAVDDGHFSNGDVRFLVSSRHPASALPTPLQEMSLGGKHLRIDYAGIDLLVARLE